MNAKWLAEALDHAFIRFGIRPTLPVVSSRSRLARLRRAEERTQPELTDARLFPTPVLPHVSAVRSRVTRGGSHCVSREWTAAAIPLEFDWGIETRESLPVRTDWYTRTAPRPLLIALAGWTPIRGLAQRVLWPVERLDRAGFDLVIPSLQSKAEKGWRSWQVDFPSADPSSNLLEVARGVSAIRQIVAYARELGHDPIVVWGASLGAYLVALLGTTTPTQFDALVFEKPLARLSDPLRWHGRGTDADRQDVALRLDRVYRAVSPLERQPQVDSSKVYVVGALYDRVTTFESAARLAAHFGVSPEPVRASHLYDSGRTERFQRWASHFIEARLPTNRA